MFGTLGTPEIVIIGVVIILIFGVGKISGLGRDLGSSIKEFRKAVKEEDKEEEETAAQPAPAVAQQTTIQEPPPAAAPPQMRVDVLVCWGGTLSQPVLSSSVHGGFVPANYPSMLRRVSCVHGGTVSASCPSTPRRVARVHLRSSRRRNSPTLRISR
ncbi:MAG: twin-arginine translocase TatA/TatE family subunit [Chloroflexi bacterium]|nr:twin-arginine translocase TatA/TatE family subunit [Chloroflexota bacterium]